MPTPQASPGGYYLGPRAIYKASMGPMMADYLSRLATSRLSPLHFYRQLHSAYDMPPCLRAPIRRDDERDAPIAPHRLLSPRAGWLIEPRRGAAEMAALTGVISAHASLLAARRDAIHGQDDARWAAFRRSAVEAARLTRPGNFQQQFWPPPRRYHCFGCTYRRGLPNV